MSNFLHFLGSMAKVKLAQQNRLVDAVHTPTPLGLSQQSALQLSPVPFALLPKNSLMGDAPEQRLISAVGTFDLYGHRVYRSYLADSGGAFFQTVVKPPSMALTESKFFKPYVEVNPSSSDEWAFWLNDNDGYIGYPVMQSLNEDGNLQYQREWQSNVAGRVNPAQVREIVIDADGNTHVLNHRMMLYSRKLTGSDPVVEYLISSVVEDDEGASVVVWLGIDVAMTDLTVYPASPDSTLQNPNK